MSETKNPEQDNNKTYELVAAACHSMYRAYRFGRGQDAQDRWDMDYITIGVPWSAERQEAKARLLEDVLLVMNGGTEESLYDRHPARVTEEDASSAEYTVEGAGEGQHKARKVGDVIPFADLQGDHRVWLTLFVETVRSMQYVLTPPVVVGSRKKLRS